MKAIHIHPTLRCNRKCSFCSYRGSHCDMSLPADFVCKVLRDGHELGYNKLRISGGGEPLVHSRIVTILSTAKFYGYDISLQTNGDFLSFFHKKVCTDIRVSLGDGLPFNPKRWIVQPHGYNYVVTAMPDYELLNNVIRYSIAHSQYVRIVTDETDTLNTPSIDEIRQHVPESGLITYHDGKTYHKGKKKCPSTHILLGADGYWYPCCRTQYSKRKNLTCYDETMRLGKRYEELSVIGKKRYNGRKCVRCYYG